MAQHQKHENQMRDLQLQCETNVRELHQLQVSSRPESRAGRRGSASSAGGWVKEVIVLTVRCTWPERIPELEGFLSSVDPKEEQFSIRGTC